MLNYLTGAWYDTQVSYRDLLENPRAIPHTIPYYKFKSYASLSLKEALLEPFCCKL